MKKFCSILLLVLFLLNALGFYGIFVGLQLNNDQQANDQLDEEHYSGADAMTFRIPLSVPYSTDGQEYVRVSGQFEHDGEIYRLVKQKLLRDTLYIVCVRDNEGKKINQALADYVKTFTDKPVNAKQQQGKHLLSFIKDYIPTGVSVEPQCSGWNKAIGFGDFKIQYLSFETSGIKYPPKQDASV